MSVRRIDVAGASNEERVAFARGFDAGLGCAAAMVADAARAGGGPVLEAVAENISALSEQRWTWNLVLAPPPTLGARLRRAWKALRGR